MANKVELKFAGLTQSTVREEVYVLLLRSTADNSKLPLMIDHAMAMILVQSGRHDLDDIYGFFEAFIRQMEVSVESVEITNIDLGKSEAVFKCMRDVEGFGFDFSVSAPVAVAYAMAKGIPIKADPALVAENRMTEGSNGNVSLPITGVTTELLESAMKTAVENEDYELAAQIRDELNRRK